MPDRAFRLIPINTNRDLAEAASEQRAFVFLWVNWAIHAQQSQQVVEAVVDSWQAKHPEMEVPCYMIDLSDQSGEVWDATAFWLEREGRPAGTLMMSGVGPLLWVHDGRIVAHALPNAVGREKLEAMSNGIWT